MFTPGEVSKVVAMETHDDNITEISEEIVIRVVKTDEISLGQNTEATFTVTNNDG